jgi:FkbM family methyltransferase
MQKLLKAVITSIRLRRDSKVRIGIKRVYCRLIDPFDRGRRISLNIGINLHVPTYMATTAYTNYEEAAMLAFLRWLRSNPKSVVADVGCSMGIYSILALQASPGAQVYAFDSDSVSLKITSEFCRYSDVSRLHLIHGFLTEKNSSGSTMARALAQTNDLLSASNSPAEPTALRYICLDRPLPEEAIERHSLDGLFLDRIPKGLPMLIKIDVEGAELIVLRGMNELMRLSHPTILLSVHPQFLSSFQHSQADVAAYLRSYGYEWTVLSKDHEEHWWCLPIAN